MNLPDPVAGPPPREALRAFGVRVEPVLLDGGRRRTWRAGDVVLKPVGDPDEHDWLCGSRCPGRLRGGPPAVGGDGAPAGGARRVAAARPSGPPSAAGWMHPARSVPTRQPGPTLARPPVAPTSACTLDGAGHHAVATFGERWRPLVAEALTDRAVGAPSGRCAGQESRLAEETAAFAELALERALALRPPG
jgi:hypothetical protein